MSLYLITGGAGFIGSNLSEELIRCGHRVRVFDNFSSGSEENLKDILSDIELINGDVRDKEAVEKAVKGVDFVLHQAAIASVQASIRDPIQSNEVILGGTLNVLCAARDSGVKRVVLASSAAVYGSSEILPKKENMCMQALSPYAASKLAGETYAGIFNKLYGLETVCLRYFNVFGPRQDPKSEYSGVISIFMYCIREGRAPIIYGDGEQTRDFIYVKNVVSANLLAIESEKVGHGEAINIAGGDRISLNNLVQILGKLVERDIKPEYKAGRSGDIKHSQADISLAKKLLGYEIKMGFEEGLEILFKLI
ncbi:MAG: SDR family oxidoreductase [Deltaproteobacteria bacterium]